MRFDYKIDGAVGRVTGAQSVYHGGGKHEIKR